MSLFATCSLGNNSGFPHHKNTRVGSSNLSTSVILKKAHIERYEPFCYLQFRKEQRIPRHKNTRVGSSNLSIPAILKKAHIGRYELFCYLRFRKELWITNRLEVPLCRHLLHLKLKYRNYRYLGLNRFVGLLKAYKYSFLS